MTRCRRGSGTRRCKATQQCNTPRKPNDPLPGQKVFRCPKLRGVSRRQCPNRVCYPSALFNAPHGPVADTPALRARRATAVAAKVTRNRAKRAPPKRKKKEPAPPPALPPAPPPPSVKGRDTLFVALAMSHERAGDRTRLMELLKHYQYVLGVSEIAPPNTDAGYKELAPYVSHGRYRQIKFDFKNFRASTYKSPNTLFEAMGSFRVPIKIVCLDYFFLQHPYYEERYGMNWLLSNKKQEGKVRELLDHGATEVFLPVDKGGLMQQMRDEYAAFPAKTLTVRAEISPLFRSDDQIDNIPDRPSAKQSAHLYLDPKGPFLRITNKM